MIGLFGIIAIQVIGLLLWTMLLNAPILQWRSQKLKNWDINYKDAFLISIKASLVALIIIDIGIIVGALSGNPAVAIVGILFGFPSGLVFWWFAHSNALLKLAGSSSLLSVKDIRAISTNVLGYLIVVSIAFAFIAELARRLG